MTESPYHVSPVFIEAEEAQVKAAQNDPRYFEPLYTKYYEGIVRFVYHRVGDKESSFDITSQVFYKALGNLSKYKSTGVPFSAWLYRIASNEIGQWFRNSKRAGIVHIDLEGLHELKHSVDETSEIVQDQQLFAALRELEPADLELVNMRFFEKRSFTEIADILEMKESACKMKLYRILEKMKIKLQELYQ